MHIDALAPASLHRFVLPREEGGHVATFSLPLADIQGHWTPKHAWPQFFLPWNLAVEASAQSDYPALAFVNTQGICRGLVALSQLKRESLITARMNQEKGTYDITVESLPSAEPVELVVDCRPLPWMEALAQWRDGLGVARPAVPREAWEPVFCTWYAVHAAVEQRWVEENARLAASLGMGTLIVDDGWCFDEAKRVSPATIGDWYENVGEWELSTVKFPDFNRHVERVHQMGMRYLLWVAPFLVGKKSRHFREMPQSLLPGEIREGYRLLDPASPQADLVLRRMERLLRQTPVDGLKVDFLDQIEPSRETPTSAHVLAFVERLHRTILRERPRALVEFRQSYATPAMLPFATQFRAGDVPFDFLANFRNMSLIRLAIGEGTPVHADPVYWAPGESLANISRHLVASLLGVPMLSMDLAKLSSREREIIAFWLGFYRQNMAAYQTGRWRLRPLGSQAGYALLTAPGASSVAILQEPALLPELLPRMKKGDFLLNLSGSTLPVPGGEILFRPEPGAGQGGVPAGGAARL
ncbi:MAG: glycoside hydrolase family 36 protein [Oligosphaeraceae bacterium]